MTIQKNIAKPIDYSKKNSHYVNNREFSNAVHDFNQKKLAAIQAGEPVPPIPEYIGDCFIRIAEGMAKKPNFNNYTWKEEMIGDAVENCLRYMHNFNISFNTSSYPNAFAYFSMFVWRAFVRRIKLENKQRDIKQNMIFSSSDIPEELMYTENDFERGESNGHFQDHSNRAVMSHSGSK